MWNTLTIAYVVIAALSGLAVLAGAATGLRLGWRWPLPPDVAAEREAFDRARQLATTLLLVGIAARLALVPLWYFALVSLVPQIPGGMCLASVHHLGGADAWIASALQVIVPALLLLWLAVHREDRRRDEEPLYPAETALLAPVAIAVLVESFFDLRFFGGLELGPSPCCMTLFDAPAASGGDALAAGWHTAIAFFALTAAAIGLAVASRRGSRPWTALGSAVAAAGAAAALLFALHDALGSALMHTPSHRCIFCVWKLEPQHLASTALALAGAWLALARAGVAFALDRAGAAHGPARLGLPMALLALGALAIGVDLLL
jgi:hypothetical protein